MQIRKSHQRERDGGGFFRETEAPNYAKRERHTEVNY